MLRGCAITLDNVTASECDSETCQTCMGTDISGANEGCNSGIFPANRLSCVVCTGGENSTCAGQVTAAPTICPVYDAEDRCFVARPNRNFERGCMSSSRTRCRDGESCLICIGNGCNLVDFNSAINIHSGAKMIVFVLISIALTMINK